jgi:hypothetical protein
MKIQAFSEFSGIFDGEARNPLYENKELAGM